MSVRLIVLLLFIPAMAKLRAQDRGYNVYLQVSPTLTLDTRFADGHTVFRSPDNKTGNNTIYPLYSVLDGRPNQNLTFMQNLARKFTWTVILEKYLNEKHSFNGGFEVGARGYKVISANSVSSLISYRNLGAPVYFSRYLWLGSFWTLKWNYGGILNYSWSIPESNRVVKIARHPVFYPLLGGGVEMAYMGKEGKLSFELAFYKGWQNILDHVYVGVDNRYGERIVGTGTHVRLGLKYNFRRFEPRKRVKQVIVPPAVTVPDDFHSRELKAAKEMKVASDSINVCLTDDQTVDGDSVVLMFNGEILSGYIALGKTPHCIRLGLRAGRNSLAVHAVNEGKIKPNTYQISVYDGKEEQAVRLKSDMQSSAVLSILKEP